MDDSEACAVEPLVDRAGVVETALAEALRLAAQAAQWDVVAALAQELSARRVGRSSGSPTHVASRDGIRVAKER